MVVCQRRSLGRNQCDFPSVRTEYKLMGGFVDITLMVHPITGTSKKNTGSNTVWWAPFPHLRVSSPLLGQEREREARFKQKFA